MTFGAESTIVNPVEIIIFGIYLAIGAGCGVWTVNRVRVDPWKARFQGLRTLLGRREAQALVAGGCLLLAVFWPIGWPWLWHNTRHDDGTVP